MTLLFPCIDLPDAPPDDPLAPFVGAEDGKLIDVPLPLLPVAPVDPDAATNYALSPQDITTDADIQAARDLQLGINDSATYHQNILNIPYVEAEYDKASSEEGDEYWKNLGDEWNLNEKNPEEFISSSFRYGSTWRTEENDGSLVKSVELSINRT